MQIKLKVRVTHLLSQTLDVIQTLLSVNNNVLNLLIQLPKHGEDIEIKILINSMIFRTLSMLSTMLDNSLRDLILEARVNNKQVLKNNLIINRRIYHTLPLDHNPHLVHNHHKLLERNP
jgi:hypothetical protein